VEAATSTWRAIDYLEILYSLLFPVGEYRPSDAKAPIAARVADRLGVSRASAGEMLRRLAEQGLVARGPGRALALTVEGIALAESGVRATRVIETFLVSYLGYPPADVHARALTVREAFTPGMIDRLHERLGSPPRCPHGWPVSTDAERREAPELRRLIELEEGARCKIVGVTEDDPDLIGWLFAEGLVPGAGLRVREVQPAAGHVIVGVGRKATVVGERAARQVFVTEPD